MRRYGFIATAFPGLFGIDDLVNMDVRDFEVWYREAEVVHAMYRIERYSDHRAAGSDGPEARNTYKRLEHVARTAHRNKRRVQKEAWQRMEKAAGRRRKEK